MRMRTRRRVTRSTARRWTMATMRNDRSAYARCREMRAFYVGRGAPMAIASGARVARLGTGTTTTGGGGDAREDGGGDARDGREIRDGKRRAKSSEAVTEFVTYACATSEGGCALARRETTRGAAATRLATAPKTAPTQSARETGISARHISARDRRQQKAHGQREPRVGVGGVGAYAARRRERGAWRSGGRCFPPRCPREGSSVGRAQTKRCKWRRSDHALQAQ